MKLMLNILIFCVLKLCNSANILSIIPAASYSHQIPYRPLWRELHARGHHLTIFTTDPMNDPNLTNITEISLHQFYEISNKHNFTKLLLQSENGFLENGEALGMFLDEITDTFLKLPEVTDLINNRTYTFDLLMIESNMPALLPFSWRFNCPWISLNSLDAHIPIHYTIGNPIHPILYPDVNLKFYDLDNMNFFERLSTFTYTITFLTLYNWVYFDKEHKKLKNYFGNDLPDLRLINREMSALFINANPLFRNVRPIVPNTVLIGDGMHILPPKPLPKDIQEFLDNAENGVIYFSLGSNVRTNLMDANMFEKFITTLNELKEYRILWKIDFDDTDGRLSKHIMVRKWLPQQDILRHRNVKVFITQGGLQSLQEALVNHMPLVFIPFWGDQFQNVQKMVKHGVGIQIDRKNIDKTNFKEAIIEVLTNPKYKDAAIKTGKLLKDWPMTGLEQAVWWTEYVIRHNGTRHLRSPGFNMPFYQYYCLDVITFILIIILLLSTIIYKILKFIMRKIMKLLRKKQKVS